MEHSPIAAWRTFNAHYRLEGSKCCSCNRIHLPAVHYCPCGSKHLEAHTLKPSGTLISFTLVTNPPAEFKAMGSYCMGMIQLDQGPKLVAQLADVTLKDLQVGMRMTGMLRKMFANTTGIIHYGIKFIPE